MQVGGASVNAPLQLHSPLPVRSIQFQRQAHSMLPPAALPFSNDLRGHAQQQSQHARGLQQPQYQNQHQCQDQQLHPPSAVWQSHQQHPQSEVQQRQQEQEQIVLRQPAAVAQLTSRYDNTVFAGFGLSPPDLQVDLSKVSMQRIDFCFACA